MYHSAVALQYTGITRVTIANFKLDAPTSIILPYVSINIAAEVVEWGGIILQSILLFITPSRTA